MLFWIGHLLEHYVGPFRLLTSHVVLSMIGLLGCFGLTWTVLPDFFRYLPVDRGRAYAIESAAAKGKPTGAGIIFIPLCVLIAVVVMPFKPTHVIFLLLTVCAMASGYWDDRSQRPWNEYTKGMIDFALALLAALVLGLHHAPRVWLPFIRAEWQISPVVYVPVATVLIWICINATNCSDGVDGLSGTMVMLAFVGIGTFLYVVVGHSVVARYLGVPYYADATTWAIAMFTVAGGLGGYLWYNAYPSQVLMGDAGSRALGFFLGVSILQTGNPCMLIVACSVLCLNGGTGLLKVALLRFFNIRIFHAVRFPLHDHVRHVLHWSNTQVLVRFTLLQAILTIVMFGMLMKIR